MRAASVVRAFAAVAMRMPMNPALPDAIAAEQVREGAEEPVLRDGEDQQRDEDDEPASTVYWRRRNAMAPSAMAAMSSRIRSFPGSAAFTCRAKKRRVAVRRSRRRRRPARTRSPSSTSTDQPIGATLTGQRGARPGLRRSAARGACAGGEVRPGRSRMGRARTDGPTGHRTGYPTERATCPASPSGDRRLGRREPGHRHAERRAADIVEAHVVAERDALRISAVLPADADLQILLGGIGPSRRPSGRAGRCRRCRAPGTGSPAAPCGRRTA